MSKKTKKRDLKAELKALKADQMALCREVQNEAIICGMLVAEARHDPKLILVPTAGPWPGVTGDPAYISERLHTLRAFITEALAQHAAGPRH